MVRQSHNMCGGAVFGASGYDSHIDTRSATTSKSAVDSVRPGGGGVAVCDVGMWVCGYAGECE